MVPICILNPFFLGVIALQFVVLQSVASSAKKLSSKYSKVKPPEGAASAQFVGASFDASCYLGIHCVNWASFDACVCFEYVCLLIGVESKK